MKLQNINRLHTLRTKGKIIVLRFLIVTGLLTFAFPIGAMSNGGNGTVLNQPEHAFGEKTLIVCPDGCKYSSIQSAIDSSRSGDTIEVHSGTYYENVNASKQLNIRGIGNPVVDAKGSGSAITLTANGIILEGFTATGSGADGYYSFSEPGIMVISNNNTLIGNNASNNSIGIYLYDSSKNNTLSRNNASSNNGGDDGGSGIILQDYCNNNTLIGNIASNNNIGISISSSSNNKIYNNIFNNTDNSKDNGKNVWSINEISGTNIIGGPYIGGNFWANPDGKGFSQKCKDADKDGICDDPYAIDSDNIDYLPLANYVKPKLTVTSPNGGENWTQNKSYKIKWRSIGDTGSYVKIQLLKNGTAVKTIKSNTSNDGSYKWKIPYSIAPGTDYKIRIKSKSHPAYKDSSNKKFTIRRPG